MRPKLIFDPAACLWLVLAIFILPLNWLLAALAAAGIHELCHCVAALLLKIEIERICIDAQGCKLHMGRMTYLQELLCSMAGPMGSILLILLSEQYPRLAICGAIQGFFNLIPIYPLDGGRILRGLLCCFLPETIATAICSLAEKICCAAILIGSIFLSVTYQIGAIPLLIAAMLCIRVFRTKNTLQT